MLLSSSCEFGDASIIVFIHAHSSRHFALCLTLAAELDDNRIASNVEISSCTYHEAEVRVPGRLKGAVTTSTAGRSIAVLGWIPEQTGELVAGFSEFSPLGTTVRTIAAATRWWHLILMDNSNVECL